MALNPDTIKTLATNPPPRSKLRYWNLRKANIRLRECEAALGLSPSAKEINILRLNDRIAAAEILMGVKQPKAAPADVTAPIPVSSENSVSSALAKMFGGGGKESRLRAQRARVAEISKNAEKGSFAARCAESKLASIDADLAKFNKT